MNRDDAKDLLDLFYRRTKSTGLLTDEQRGSVLTTIMKTYDDASEVTISDVRRIVEKEVAPPAQRKIEMPVNEFEAQTVEEQTGILGDAFKTLLKQFPYLQQPFVYNQSGKVVGPANRDAYDTVIKIVKHWSSRFGTKKMTVGRVVDAVCYLDLQGLFPRKEVVVVEKPAPPPRTENDLNNLRREMEKRMNTEGDSAIRGASSAKAKPKPTEAEVLQAAEEGLNEEAAAQNVIRLIANYSPQKSRGAIAEEKTILARVFDDGKAAGKTFVQLEADVKAQVEAMAKWDNSEAIRQNYSEAARKKGIDLTKREPKKYSGEAY